MLHELYIKNYALIDELRVQFGPGLNIITGETGAGKSIIIGALTLLLGERSQRDVIRQGETSAVVEGIFDIPDSKWLETYHDLFDVSGKEVLMRREIHENGRSRCYINDSPVPLATLSEIGDRLVDFHGQHDHQALLDPEKHLQYLDKFGVDTSLLENIRDVHQKFKATGSRLNTLMENEQTFTRKREFLEFQVHEMDQLNPISEEETALEKEERILKNSERIHECFQGLNDLLYEGEGTALEKLSAAEERLSGLKQVDEPFEKWKEMCHASRIGIEELMRAFQSYISDIEFDPERLNDIRERLGQYALLKKKYGGSTEEMIRLWKEAKSELDQIGSVGTQIVEIKKQLEMTRDALTEVVLKLAEARKTAAERLAAVITQILAELGLEKTVFQVEQRWAEHPHGAIHIQGTPVKVSETGAERIEFQISTNPGEPPKPLQRVASGGEISRIMLALKTALAEADEIPILIFDEIDTGVSGRTARIVGQNLRKLSETHQIICITHLAQIASLGHLHYSVFKLATDTSVRTSMRRLDEKERIDEIGKLLGGESVTASVLQNAKELLGVD